MQRREIPGLENTYVSLLPPELRRLLAEKYYGPIEVIHRYHDKDIFNITIHLYIDIGRLEFFTAFKLEDLQNIINYWHNPLINARTFPSKKSENNNVSIINNAISIWSNTSNVILTKNISALLIEKIEKLLYDVNESISQQLEIRRLYNMRY